jgi:virginiamycin B lyase
MSSTVRQPLFAATSRRLWLVLAIVLAVGAAAVTFVLRGGSSGPSGFEEFALTDEGGTPVAIAVARDGPVWFTLESSDSIGRLRNGRIERIPKGVESIEPLGLGVDAQGRAWFTEAPKQRINRIAPDGSIESFGLATQVARLGRLAIAPDGTVWFAEPSLASVTRLREGEFTRYIVGTLNAGIPADAAPFAVAVAPDGAVWATLPTADKILRIAPDGAATAFDVPTRRSGLGDIAIAPDGAVYFTELTANKIGRFAGGRFEEFTVPTPLAGITALAVSPDGAAWFTELRGHQLARLHNGKIAEFKLPRPQARPFGIAVDAANNVWYADLSGWVGRLEARRAKVR